MTSNPLQVISVKQMYAADKRAVESGVPSVELMENAGASVVDVIESCFSSCKVVVLCGAGNNGGDGFVVARLLKEKNWDVAVALSCKKQELKGDAAEMAFRFDGNIIPLTVSALEGKALVVDALFGLGLSRPLTGKEVAVIEHMHQHPVSVVSVDIPSGVNGDTGEVYGSAIKADITVTFCRKKPGHLLVPGRQYSGEVIVKPIGIPESVLSAIDDRIKENLPDLWLRHFPFPTAEQHKYSRGHVVVRGGDIQSTGASSMAAKAALRSGAGLVTVACAKDTLPIYASRFMSVMTKIAYREKEFAELLKDERKNVALIGPGNGVNAATRNAVLVALRAGKSCVLDADALTCFEVDNWELFKKVDSPVVLTLHEGEFQKLFSTTQKDLGKIDRVKEAAAISNSVVVLKGNDTIIAHPDGQVAVNTNAPAWLATAGSGDVLSGIVAGMMANDIDPFTAACMAVWLHGEAASIAGIGLIAEELPDYLPVVLGMLYNHYHKR